MIVLASGSGKEIMARDNPLQAILQMAPKKLGVSGWHELTQAQINEFARATGDFQWMHVDVERAAREMGGTIAHGLLTLALLPALSNVSRKGDGVMVTVGCAVEVEGGTAPVLVAEWRSLYFPPVP